MTDKSTGLIFDLADHGELHTRLCAALGLPAGLLHRRRFPDGESYLRFGQDINGRDVLLLCSLDRPNEKALELMFAAAAARDLGARSVGLIAPYLAYMRQDKRFQPGEAVTSTAFAKFLSSNVDWLVTVDPHLHRRNDLGEIYDIPTQVVHAAPEMAAWIAQNVDRPLLIGPDSESAQWVSAVADAAGAPFVVLEKHRLGDRRVEVSVPEVQRWARYTPVLVDDIISTARTMIATVDHLKTTGLPTPVCLGVHAIFAGNGYDELVSAGVARIATCNTILHSSNAIDISGQLADAVGKLTR